MRISEITLTRSRIPFRQAFSHAAATRAESDVIHVEIATDSGLTGFGEIQARPYVTGETNDDAWGAFGPALASALVGEALTHPEDIHTLLERAGDRSARPATVGGFDLALHDLLDLDGRLDWSHAIGPARTGPVGKCLTIGDDHDEAGMQRQARFARLSGCTVTKLKVSGPDDAPRCAALREHLGSAIAIRLDGNGQMSPAGARALLDATADLVIESLEEPFDRNADGVTEALVDLHAATGVPLVADESACTAADVERCAAAGSYQVINVRVGKCGGISGTRAVLDAALSHGLGLVCGTMVGESAVLLRYSRKLLHHCDALGYVEGIDQNRTLLADEVIVPSDNSDHCHFQWQTEARAKYAVGRQTFP